MPFDGLALLAKLRVVFVFREIKLSFLFPACTQVANLKNRQAVLYLQDYSWGFEGVSEFLKSISICSILGLLKGFYTSVIAHPQKSLL